VPTRPCRTCSSVVQGQLGEPPGAYQALGVALEAGAHNTSLDQQEEVLTELLGVRPAGGRAELNEDVANFVLVNPNGLSSRMADRELSGTI
jgi:hypothetical protein